MPDNRPSKKQLEKLAEEIKQDQQETSPAEKRVKVNLSFKKAIKKMVQTSPPKKQSK